MNSKTLKSARVRALKMLDRAKIVVTPKERRTMEVADFALGRLDEIGLEIVVYENNDRYCAKELILFPRQTCPEHRHPNAKGRSGKMETFRCRWGEVYLYVPGKSLKKIKARLPKKSDGCFTVFKEIVLKPGQQYTIPSDTLHWFQAGAKGAIVSEFSTTSTDDADVFTDRAIRRV